MSNTQGIFIVIEGVDGSGKETQFNLLAERLRAKGNDVVTFDFPRYAEPSSYFVHSYLNGMYGTAEEVGPYTSSLFYAMDRYETTPDIRSALEARKIVLANRFTASNMAHQGAKFDTAEERRGYFIWIDNLEFKMLGLPRPTASFVLRLPAETAQMLVDKKQHRDYTTMKRDIHEADINHLIRSTEVYDEICKLFPKDFKQLDCMRDGNLLSIDAVHQLLWENIQPLLPTPTGSNTPPPPAASISNPYIEKTTEGYHITAAGRGLLKAVVTETKDNVYAFTGQLSTTAIANTITQLSRRGEDMRTIILDEFAPLIWRHDKITRQDIESQGTRRFVSNNFVMEDVSRLLAQKVRQSQSAIYVDNSTLHYFADQKDTDGKYKYFTPDLLNDQTKELYRATMNQIFDLYSGMVSKLTDHIGATNPKSKHRPERVPEYRNQACDILQVALPLAVNSTVCLYATREGVEQLVAHLLGDGLAEATITGQKLLEQAQKIIPNFLKDINLKSENNTFINKKSSHGSIQAIARTSLNKHYSSTAEAVRLVNLSPRNELDILPFILYEHSNLSIKEIEYEVAAWSYEQKLATFNTYADQVRVNSPRTSTNALRKLQYNWDIISDYGIFNAFQRNQHGEIFEFQRLSPRYGYETPTMVEEAGLEEPFETCFGLSTKLYSTMQLAGYELEAQYATLMGHKIRWNLTHSALDTLPLFYSKTSSNLYPGYSTLALQVREKMAEVHPLLAGAMEYAGTYDNLEADSMMASQLTESKMDRLT